MKILIRMKYILCKLKKMSINNFSKNLSLPFPLKQFSNVDGQCVSISECSGKHPELNCYVYCTSAVFGLAPGAKR